MQRDHESDTQSLVEADEETKATDWRRGLSEPRVNRLTGTTSYR